jgi:hypothetical protein
MKQVLAGCFAYYAVHTNGRTLSAFRYRIIDLWRRSLQRCSQKDGTTWERITKLVNNFLPRVQNLHPSPLDRFVVKHPRWEPSVRIGPARSVRGALSNERPYRDPPREIRISRPRTSFVRRSRNYRTALK